MGECFRNYDYNDQASSSFDDDEYPTSNVNVDFYFLPGARNAHQLVVTWVEGWDYKLHPNSVTAVNHHERSSCTKLPSFSLSIVPH